MSINYRDFCDVINRIEPYYKTAHLSHKYDKVRELFQVSRRQNHIVQQVTLFP